MKWLSVSRTLSVPLIQLFVSVVCAVHLMVHEVDFDDKVTVT